MTENELFDKINNAVPVRKEELGDNGAGHNGMTWFSIINEENGAFGWECGDKHGNIFSYREIGNMTNAGDLDTAKFYLLEYLMEL